MTDKRRMSKLATVEGRCGSCQQSAELTLSESRRQRRALDVFRRGLDDRVDRWVSCSACRRAYPAGATTLFDDPGRWVEPGRGAAAEDRSPRAAGPPEPSGGAPHPAV